MTIRQNVVPGPDMATTQSLLRYGESPPPAHGAGAPGAVPVWLIDLPRTRDAADGGRDALDAEERARARGFVRDWAGPRNCGVHIALRRLLTLRRSIRSFAACTSSRSCSSPDSRRLMAGVVARSTAWPWRPEHLAVAPSWNLRDVDTLAGDYGVTALDLLSGPTRACEALPSDRRTSTRAGVKGGGR
ncbi:hypothetical protein QFZ32_000646 [Streptomyces canus]|nr:hypothetical protein [Streptomyces canus]